MIFFSSILLHPFVYIIYPVGLKVYVALVADELAAVIVDDKDLSAVTALACDDLYRASSEFFLIDGVLQREPVGGENLARITDKRAELVRGYEVKLLFEKLEDLYSDSVSKKLDVILVSSVCGGTGSGILGDVTYNIRAYAKSRKWDNFRVGGCLLMPDVLFANLEIYQNDELRTLLLANGYATLKEVSDYIQAAYEGKSYVSANLASAFSTSPALTN